MALFVRWTMPAPTPVERLATLGGMKAGMPPEVLQGMLDIVRTHRDDKARARITPARSCTSPRCWTPTRAAGST
jgi:hypothetical protein